VAGLCPDALEELTAIPQTPQLDLGARDHRGWGWEEKGQNRRKAKGMKKEGRGIKRWK